MSGVATRRPVKPSDNPFRSTAVDALNYHAAGGESLEQIEAQLSGLNYRAAILGPHGHGKSTLMRHLVGRPLPTNIRSSITIQVAADGTNTAAVRVALTQPADVLLWIDGYDLLSARLRWALRRRPYVVVTSHRKTALPTLICRETSPMLLGQLIDRLSPAVRFMIDETQLNDLNAEHHGNVRDALRELYDRCAAGEFKV